MFVRAVIVLCVVAALWAAFARPSVGSGHEQRYVVQPHDTLWSIAASHYAGDPRAAIWKLERRNGLAGMPLRVGQTLVLP